MLNTCLALSSDETANGKENGELQEKYKEVMRAVPQPGIMSVPQPGIMSVPQPDIMSVPQPGIMSVPNQV